MLKLSFPFAFSGLILLQFWLALALHAEALPTKIEGFLGKHCSSCHEPHSAEAGLDISSLERDLDDGPAFQRWVKLLDRVTKREMPPRTEPQPSAEERAEFVDCLTTSLVEKNLQRYAAGGRTPLRRLNRREYERTVQTLLHISTPLQQLLPAEQPVNGFDTVSAGLRFSPLHMERFVEAASAALDDAVRLTIAPKAIQKRFLYVDQEGVLKNVEEEHAVVKVADNAAVLFTNASYISKVHGLDIEHAGTYTLRIRCWAHQSPDRPVIARLQAGNYGLGTDRYLGMFDALPDQPQEFELRVRLEKGDYLYPAPDDLTLDPENKGVWNVGGKQFQGAGLAVEWIDVEGPHEPQWPPESVTRLFRGIELASRERPIWKHREHVAFELQSASPATDAERLLTEFASRAFRRPLESNDADPFVQIAKQALDSGASFEEAVRLGVRAILCSPQFLILDEKPGRLDAYALAARLSYFLTSSMPDDELMVVAANGSLLQDDVLRQQTERLLRDARSNDFLQSFVNQWLDLHKINATNPDMKLYPEFDDSLKHSMLGETYAFVREILDHDLSVSNFIESDFTMLNRRLAEHYGIANVQEQSFQRVALANDSVRGGLMTQASILKVTANGTVTSPVIRGSWVMSRLLNQPPPPPPPSVSAIEPDTRGATTIREQLALHRNDASCNACHANFDPAGFALENFDVIGGWRDRYRSQDKGDPPESKLHGRHIWEYKLGQPIDPSGELRSGESFANIREFKKLLGQEPDRVAKAVTENLLVYATGNPIELADRSTVDEILRRSNEQKMGFRTIVHQVVQSDLFRSK